nr:cytochrome P450 CYP749A22-like [Ipomoea batatas]
MDRMSGLTKAFGAVSDVASTAWAYAKELSNSPVVQPKLNILGVQSSQTRDLQGSSLTPLEDSLNGMFTGMVKSGEMIVEIWMKYDGKDVEEMFTGMVKSGEMIVEIWMKYDGKDVEVFQHFTLLASQLISNASLVSNCNIFPATGGIVKKNGEMDSKELLVANQESKNSIKISIEEVADEYKAFCYVGCVATTSLLGWAIHKLSRDKNLQERARTEVIQMFGCQNPNLDGIAKLKIVDEIIEDCQRQYPLLPFTKGTKQVESVPFKSSSCYSAGTHLGLNFAKIEAKVVLSMILRRFASTLSPSYIHSPVQGFTVTPKHGIRVILHKLEQEGSQITRIVKTVGVIATIGVASTACGYAKQLPSSHINGMDLCGKAFGAVSGVSSTAWGYAKQLPSSHINGKAFDAVSGVSSAACGYAKQLSNLATDQQKLGILAVQSSQIADLLNLYGMCTGLGVNATTVGAVATVGVAAWGVYMLAGGPGKKMMMKNPGRPWELIDAEPNRREIQQANNDSSGTAVFASSHCYQRWNSDYQQQIKGCGRRRRWKRKWTKWPSLRGISAIPCVSKWPSLS